MDHSQKGWGHPCLGLPLARGKGCPNSHTAAAPCISVFRCPRHDVGQLLPLPQTADHGHAPCLPPWSHGYSEGQGWALLTRAVRPPNHIVSQHQTALTKREALLAGFQRLVLPADWPRVRCLNAGWPKIPGSAVPRPGGFGFGCAQEGSR